MDPNGMRGPDLPHRRYSMPETVMRKFRLGQSSSSSSESSSRGSNRPRRHIVRRKPAKPQYRVNRSSQTSPQIKCQLSSQCLSDQVLLESSPSLPRRANSFPELSSSDEGKVYKCLRPISAGEKAIGTPSPTQVSCYGQPGVSCGLYSNSTWSYTSSDYTLSQTVSDRTTSTQDSTLSVQSTSPSTMTPCSYNSEKARMLENSLFAPSGNFIAVHTECLLIRPIEISDNTENWHFGFAPDDTESRLAMKPQSIGVNTEDDIEAITSGRKDRSTSIGEFPKIEPPEVLQLMIDKSTHMGESEEEINVKTFEIGVNTESEKQIQDVEELTTTVGIQASENNQPEVGNLSVGCQTTSMPVFKVPYIKIFKSSTESQKSEDRKEIEQMNFRDHQTSRRRPKLTYQQSIPEPCLSRKLEKSEQTCESLLRSSKSFPPYSCNQKGGSRVLDTDIACTGGNYKDLREADSVIARFSAVPRSNSMIVNTSSVDYSSDSDLSLTDSLEDQVEVQEREDWPMNRHDSRLVRGEVSLEADPKTVKRHPKGGDAYAYFLSITGEQDMIKHYPIPEWLKTRLKKREEEIKKLFEVKLNKNQTIIYRRRKKTVKHIANYTESNSSNSKDQSKRQKTPKSVKWECKNGDQDPTAVPSTSKRFVEKSETPKSRSKETGESNQSMQLKPSGQISEEEAQPPEKEESSLAIQTKNPNQENNIVHISEIIKIEMSNQLKTVITKEKQINLNHDAFLKDGRNIQTSEVINNEDANNSQKIIMKTNVGHFFDSGSMFIELEQKNKNEAIECKHHQEKNDERPQIKNEISVEEQKEASKKVLSKNEGDRYSFKHFRPLFNSKADDKTVAEILLAAMEENNRMEESQNSALKFESKAVDTADSPFTMNRLQQTGESTDESEEMEAATTEQSCNTSQPYLSESIQTTESFLESSFNLEFRTVDKDTDTSESSDNSPSPNPGSMRMTDDKGINTASFSISTQVQTKESFHEGENYFVEAPNNVDIAIDTFQEEEPTQHEAGTAEKSCNTTNPLVTSSVQTEAVNEVKPLIFEATTKTGKRKDQTSVHFSKKIGGEKSARNKNDPGTTHCKRTGHILTEDNSTQVLELNLPPCTCHMCTLHRKTLAASGVGAEKIKDFQTPSNNIKCRLQTRRMPEKKDEKKSGLRFGGGRRNGVTNKFQRKFEVIPEEKNSSNESVTEEQIIPLDLSKEWKVSSLSKGTMTKEKPVTKEVFVTEELINKEIRQLERNLSPPTIVNEIEKVSKKIQVTNKSQQNLVFGRFKAMPQEEENKRNKDVPMLGDGMELVRQYKGRAALATTQVEGHDELMTLSKGWINFYLLKDNQEFSDNEELNWYNEGNPLLHSGPPAKVTSGSKIAEEKFKQYTVEIHATPEPIQPTSKGFILPNLPQKEIKRKSKSNNKIQSNVSLPEIHSSSSSSTPENINEKLTLSHHRKYQHHHQQENYQHNQQEKYQHHHQEKQLPEVNGTKKLSRREINTMREHVAIEKRSAKSGVERELDIGAENSLSTKAVEVARSEHSVSSITSSTVILSESPSPQQLQLTERKSQKHTFYSQPANDLGASWTVTVAGSSGMKNQTPPNVEMKLTFGKQTMRSSQENSNQEKSIMQYNSHHTSHISRSKRQGGYH